MAQKKEKDALRRSFKAPIELPADTKEKILYLSRCLVHLWNMTQEQAERWLETKERAITAFSFNFWLTEARKQAILLDDGTEVKIEYRRFTAY